MDTMNEPLDAEELLAWESRIADLPPEHADWVARLYGECLRARQHEAALETGADGGAGYEAQLAQVALDAAEWLRTLWNVGYMGAGNFPSQPRTAFPLIELEDVLKSSLFARIREGKRPLPFPPPTRNGLPWHALVEGAPGPHPVHAELMGDGAGAIVGAIIEGCVGWNVVETVQPASELIVQHRGKGPVYRLSLNPLLSSLERLAPRWTRQIRQRMRAGLSSYALLWPETGETMREIPLRAASWERAESEAAYWIANNHPEMYGQVSFERLAAD